MSRDVAPQPVIELAEARAAARRARDWTAADRLKGDIEAAGWKVIDSGTMYDLLRAAAPDVNVDGTDRYGSEQSDLLVTILDVRTKATTIPDYGDAYWRAGRKLEAKFQWTIAADLDPKSDIGKLAREKLDNGLGAADSSSNG